MSQVTVDLRELEILCKKGAGLSNLTSLLTDVVEQKRQDALDCFTNESDPSGVPWKPLAKSTLGAKQSPYIGRESEKLFNAVRDRVSGNEGEIFNDVPYAGFFNAVRPFLDWTPEDEQMFSEVMGRGVKERLK